MELFTDVEIGKFLTEMINCNNLEVVDKIFLDSIHISISRDDVDPYAN